MGAKAPKVPIVSCYSTA